MAPIKRPFLGKKMYIIFFSGFNLKWGDKVGSDAKDPRLNKNNFYFGNLCEILFSLCEKYNFFRPDSNPQTQINGA